MWMATNSSGATVVSEKAGDALAGVAPYGRGCPYPVCSRRSSSQVQPSSSGGRDAGLRQRRLDLGAMLRGMVDGLHQEEQRGRRFIGLTVPGHVQRRVALDRFGVGDERLTGLTRVLSNT